LQYNYNGKVKSEEERCNGSSGYCGSHLCGSPAWTIIRRLALEVAVEDGSGSSC